MTNNIPINLVTIKHNPDVWQMMVTNFYAIHNAHVQMVQNNLQLFINASIDEEQKRQLMGRFLAHDMSKTEEPEFTPYVWRYWRTTWRQKYYRGEIDTRFTEVFDALPVDYFITQGVWHHVQHNRHHPEYHLDHDDMNKVDLIEMVCDWCAVSEERHGNIFDWIEYVVPRRYHFGMVKKAEIIRLTQRLQQYKQDAY